MLYFFLIPYFMIVLESKNLLHVLLVNAENLFGQLVLFMKLGNIWLQ